MMTNSQLRATLLTDRTRFIKSLHAAMPGVAMPFFSGDLEVLAVYDNWFALVSTPEMISLCAPDEMLETLSALFAYAESVLARTSTYDAENKVAYLMSTAIAPHINVTLP